MTVPLWCLLGFAAWTLAILVFGIGTVRIGKVARGEARPSDFPADVPHGSDSYRRTIRAHANCVENLPVFGAVVLTAAVSGVDTGALDALAVTYLVCRVGQSSVHMASGRNRAIRYRFLLFVVQLGCVVAMGAIVALHHL